MIKNHLTRRTIAIFFLLNFLSTIIPYNSIYANNTGPNAPEAASFEPVDATDMVNLSTGDFTYVLPLLNVPSPEGGYPIALAYHAGIAMDQESSMIGLGWNLNPGAINRNVNGAPDDYNSASVTDYLWDKEQTVKEYNASVGFSFVGGSVGLGLSWGSHKSLGGHVSIGIGMKLVGGYSLGLNTQIGTDGASVGLGLNHPSGLSFGMNANSRGSLAGSLGFDKNGSGFNISTNGAYGLSIGGESKSGTVNSLEITFSSSGVGLSVSSHRNSKTDSYTSQINGNTYSSTKSARNTTGVGLNVAFSNTSQMGDYTTSTSGWSIPLFVPIGLGFLSFSFGKTEYKFALDVVQQDRVTGPIYFNSELLNERIYKYKWRSCEYETVVFREQIQGTRGIPPSPPRLSPSGEVYDSCSGGRFVRTGSNSSTGEEYGYYVFECLYRKYKYKYTYSDVAPPCHTFDSKELIDTKQSYMDLLELPVSSGDFSDEEEKLFANPNFPNYDKFNVQAQGLSGAITARLFENKALFGFSGKEDAEGNTLDYLINGDSSVPEDLRFSKKSYFYFENEISTYLETPIAKFTNSTDILNSLTSREYSSISLSNNSKSEFIARRVTGNYIDYYTNKEILNDETRLLNEGFLKPSVSGFVREDMPESGIGAFKITSVDGKTYHYSLPVYNHEIVQRTYGMNDDYGTSNPREENESYFEKRQMEPFATHWLLTAVTGPDYIDKNGDGIANEGDYGYWVDFEYGKYSDAFVWSSSYGEDIIVNPRNNQIKTWVRGRKDQYYIDRIKTRTHTALFIKSKRKDGKSIQFDYNYAIDERTYSSDNGGPAFSIPSQFPLKLDKIVLVKNEDDLISKESGEDNYQNIAINYPREGGKSFAAVINRSDNVIDIGDDFSSLANKSIKSVVFNNDNYDLVKGTPNSNTNHRLTLRGVYFNGKKEMSLLPPYRFNYINSDYTFNKDDKDNYGYYKNNPSLWSLNEIITPQGGRIKIDYDSHKVKPIGTPLRIENKTGFDPFNFIEILDEKTFVTSIGKLYNGLFTQEDDNFKVIHKIGSIFEGSLFSYCSDQNTYTGEKVLYSDLVGFLVPIYPIREAKGKKFHFKITEILDTFYDSNGEFSKIKAKCEIIDDVFPDIVQNEGFMNSYRCKNSLTMRAYDVYEDNVGVRVSRVSTIDDNNNHYSMDYSYGENGDGIGFVAYLPNSSELAVDLPYSSELPPPKPSYEYVTTSTSVYKNGQEDLKSTYGIKTQYKFNALKDKQVGKAKFGDFYEITSEQIHGSNSSNKQLRSYTIKDNLGTIGQLLGIKTFNKEGHLLSNIENRYYSINDETPNKLGITQESYQTYKKITDKDNNKKELVVGSTRITYPALLKNSRELIGGDSYTSEFNDFDPITGQARETYSYSSTGQKFKTRGIQAFRQYPGMGSKVVSINNKNMLTQSAGETNFIFKNGNWKEIGGSITTWKSSWIYPLNNITTDNSDDIWRKHESYVWNGNMANDGTINNFVEFNYNTISNNSNWKKISEITKYNQFSQPIEIKDVNNNYAATKMGDNYSKVIATSNAAYDDMFFSGAEYLSTEDENYFDGGIKSKGWLKVIKEDAHTGNYVVDVNTGEKAFEVQVPSRLGRNTQLKKRFKVSVWVRKGDEEKVKIKLNINQEEEVPFNDNERVYAGNWVLLSGYVNIPESGANVSITSTSGIARLDDFRLHPISSAMKTYVYNEWDEVSYITGVDGLSVNYIYDSSGRLIRTKVEVQDNSIGNINGGFKIRSSNSYNYKK